MLSEACEQHLELLSRVGQQLSGDIAEMCRQVRPFGIVPSRRLFLRLAIKVKERTCSAARQCMPAADRSAEGKKSSRAIIAKVACKLLRGYETQKHRVRAVAAMLQ